MKRSASFGAFVGTTFAVAGVQRRRHGAVAQLSWLAVAAVLVLVASAAILRSMVQQSSVAPASAVTRQGLQPEQILTLPARIQAHVREMPQAPDTWSRSAAGQVLRPEVIVTLPAQIHAAVRGTSDVSSTRSEPRLVALRPEVIATFPSQVQESIRRGTLAGRPEARHITLRPEAILTLPQRIQAQVR